MYRLLVRLFKTEFVFKMSLSILKMIEKIPFGTRLLSIVHSVDRPELACEHMGLKFVNPVGLGAGVDKSGKYSNILSAYGYSFVEVGPTQPQSIKEVIDNLKNKSRNVNIALDIARTKDFITCFTLSYDFADMFVINFMGPSQSNIKDEDNIIEILSQILDARITYDEYKPVLVKLLPNMSKASLELIVDYCLMNGVDGIFASSEEDARFIRSIAGPRICIVGYGGIRNHAQAEAMLKAGADLIEVTTGLILEGPNIVRNILKKLDCNAL